MRDLWPETSLNDVFDTKGDPCPGQPIEDKYGLVSYGVDSMLASFASLPSLKGIEGYSFLALFDPEEHERVTRAARHRALALRKKSRRKDGPDWLVAPSPLWDTDMEDMEQEYVALKRAGLTIEEAQELVDKSKQTKEPN